MFGNIIERGQISTDARLMAQLGIETLIRKTIAYFDLTNNYSKESGDMFKACA